MTRKEAFTSSLLAALQQKVTMTVDWGKMAIWTEAGRAAAPGTLSQNNQEAPEVQLCVSPPASSSLLQFPSPYDNPVRLAVNNSSSFHLCRVIWGKCPLRGAKLLAHAVAVGAGGQLTSREGEQACPAGAGVTTRVAGPANRTRGR
jgi:hypothetical protein